MPKHKSITFSVIFLIAYCLNSQETKSNAPTNEMKIFSEWISGSWDEGILDSKYEDIANFSWGQVKGIPNISIIFDLLIDPSLVYTNTVGKCRIDSIIQITSDVFKLSIYTNPDDEGNVKSRDLIITRLNENTMTIIELMNERDDTLNNGFWIATKEELLKKRDGYSMYDNSK